MDGQEIRSPQGAQEVSGDIFQKFAGVDEMFENDVASVVDRDEK